MPPIHCLISPQGCLESTEAELAVPRLHLELQKVCLIGIWSSSSRCGVSGIWTDVVPGGKVYCNRCYLLSIKIQ